MGDRDKVAILALMAGVCAGAFLSGLYNTFIEKHNFQFSLGGRTNTKLRTSDKSLNQIQNQPLVIPQFDINNTNNEFKLDNINNIKDDKIDNMDNMNNLDNMNNMNSENNNKHISDHQLHINYIDCNTSFSKENEVLVKQGLGNTSMEKGNDMLSKLCLSNIHDSIKIRNKKELSKIKEVDKSPLELRKRFENKGYVFITRNLATVNTELNEFVELMRKLDLSILNGCIDPLTCKCHFRHKRCRLFMIRKYSDNQELQFFSPSCTGVANISPSNKDIQNGTPMHEFVQLFQNKFADRVSDLINYIHYITNPDRNSAYVVDVTMIADPCVYTGLFDVNNKVNKINEINETDNVNNIDKIDKIDIDNNVINNNKNDITNKLDNGKIVVDAKLETTNSNKCTLKWHQDMFINSETNTPHAYDYVALFVLKYSDITPHKLMIGKIKDDIDTSKMSLDDIQEHVVPLADTWIDHENNSDTGYIIDQKREYLHKHSDFDYINTNAKRNVITIRIKYLN